MQLYCRYDDISNLESQTLQISTYGGNQTNGLMTGALSAYTMDTMKEKGINTGTKGNIIVRFFNKLCFQNVPILGTLVSLKS